MVTKHKYIPLLRRKRSGKTDYRARKAILLGRKPYLVPRITGRNTSVQVLSANRTNDVTIASAHSRELVKFGWKISRNSTPAAYLTGLLAGCKAMEKGIKEANLYLGLHPFIHGSRIAAVAKGINEAGMTVPIDEETYPSEARVKGEHIATYAKALLADDKLKYKTRFAQMIASGVNPEDYPEHVNEVRDRIIKELKNH